MMQYEIFKKNDIGDIVGIEGIGHENGPWPVDLFVRRYIHTYLNL